MKQLWQKDTNVNRSVERFTVGKDRELDVLLARADVLGSLAHTRMLESIGLMSSEDLESVQRELKQIFAEVEQGDFTIEDGVEDVHSQVEFLLTERIGQAGKKIHSGRSRNDQVLVDLRIFLRREMFETVMHIKELFDTLQALSEKYKNVLMPGYTHLQVAMPSSFGLWFGAYAESLVDDTQMALAAYRICNRNPLGSAAGYGSSFPLNRTMTTELLGFDSMDYNVVYAQMGRGKTERVVAQAIAAYAATLGKFAMDNTLFLNQNFSFISYPPELTTGSSIMPHKKNPDVWEIIRGKCNLLQALPNQITMLTTNLPTGYHRDLQLMKEVLFPALADMRDIIAMAKMMLENISVVENITADEKYKYMFSVEVVNNMVLSGTPFREAYKTVGLNIEHGNFEVPDTINHTHEGSIGNLCNDRIAELMNGVIAEFGFERVEKAEYDLAH
ncbi:MAG: argininosuccinate lyase [Rikenellaceae bacterium]|nr:argininosuccinate lyase [Rikenellaceae bacterium]